MAQAANVTKYNAGGSGDNYIADGYIKSVEKVWMDSYTIAFTNTNTTIDIAILPENKKITSIDVMIETSASQTSGTVSIGFSTDSTVDTFLAATTVTHNLTLSTISFPAVGILGAVVALTQPGGNLKGFQKVTSGTQTTVAIKLNNWTMTTGTIKSIVRYT
jgi:hypothetical protein